MSFNFSITPQQLKGINSPTINTPETKGVSSAGLFGVNSPQINSGNCIDSFTKTSTQAIPQKRQNQGFESIYQKYYNAQTINDSLNSNIQGICDKNSISSKVNAQQVVNVDRSHLEKTYEYASMIGNRMGLNPNEKEDLKTGAILHDIGKAYIPNNILNKPGKLDEQEKTVMDSHSELGAELARQMGANDNVVDMIKNHHTDNSGNKLTGILQVADRYSALTQQRSYKIPFTNDHAFNILDKEVQDGKLNGEALNCLKQAVNTRNMVRNQFSA